MNRIFFTADLHFGHRKEFLWRPRGFNNVQEMNEAIIKNFNEVMDWNDDLFILGDVMLNDNESGIKLLQQIPGHKHIIIGNHDTDTRVLMYENTYNVQVDGYATVFKYGGLHFYLSHYPTLTSNHDYDKPLKARVINLCGHTHTQDRWADWDKGYIYHCELDAHNCYPILIDNIIEDIKQMTN